MREAHSTLEVWYARFAYVNASQLYLLVDICSVDLKIRSSKQNSVYIVESAAQLDYGCRSLGSLVKIYGR